MLIVETYLSQTESKGAGLFSKDLLPKGTTWWIRSQEFDKIALPVEFSSYTELAQSFIKEYGFLESTGNWYLCIDNARFCNHSDKPNSINEFNENGELISCITIKDVFPGEEILCDYRKTCITCKDNLGFENKEQ
ncbi:MAG TPA: SET domain-containing protein [Cytophagaceae bacterium]|jgi:hypothetical protein|nr:SET domain-containing protein [Cytophagaceae bacterium]